MTGPFCSLQVQGHLSRSRSNIKAIVFDKMAVAGAFVSSVYMGIPGQLFKSFLPHLPQFFLLKSTSGPLFKTS